MITQVITRIVSFKLTFYCHMISCIGPACCLRWEQFLHLILNKTFNSLILLVLVITHLHCIVGQSSGAHIHSYT